MSDNLYGGIEAGGTKFICMVAGGPQDIRASVRIDTTSPSETLSQVTAFFQKERLKTPIKAIGIGSFGPIDLDPASSTYGFINLTPKLAWSNTNVLGKIQESLQLPVKIDTDVNAAALGEGKWGAARGLDDFIYLTVGTGIGGGAVAGGKLVHGLVHPEMGHMWIKHDLFADPFQGCCPFHADCLEGLASGGAIQARWGKPAQELPSDHPAWNLEALYLAEGIMNLICVLSPRRIILGGGVGQRKPLLDEVRRQVNNLLNGYIQNSKISGQLDDYIVSPGLGDLAGVLGAVALAQEPAAIAH
jgi:fructokinase